MRLSKRKAAEQAALVVVILFISSYFVLYAYLRARASAVRRGSAGTLLNGGGSYTGFVDLNGSRGFPLEAFLTPNDEAIKELARSLPVPPPGAPIYEPAWKCVLSLEYERDPAGGDFWQFPNETLARRGGDCEDLAFLLASLLLAEGLESRVAFGWTFASNGSGGYHAWTQVRYGDGGERWVDLETTLEHPVEFRSAWKIVTPDFYLSTSGRVEATPERMEASNINQVH
ncbi:MAG: hypothetical protein Kow0069_09670 [Promethearchaeota archaeon]